MQVESQEDVFAAVTGGDMTLKKMAKLKATVDGIDWLLRNEAVAGDLTREQLIKAARLLRQEIIMTDYGL